MGKGGAVSVEEPTAKFGLIFFFLFFLFGIGEIFLGILGYWVLGVSTFKRLAFSFFLSLFLLGNLKL